MKYKKIPRFIEIKIDDEPKVVYSATYVEAKLKSLREFGYTDLKRETVEKQLLLIVNGEETTDVIGAFMEQDIVVS